MENMEENISQILEKVHKLVQDHHLVSDRFSAQEKVVEFRYPKELECLLPLEIKKDGLTDEELEKLCEQLVSFSVKTIHPLFFNQLYHGVDEYGLAGAWLSEALNTNNHTYEVAPPFILIEQTLIKYIGGLCGWGDQTDGIFSPGGSISNMYGMVLARQKKYPELKSTGLFGRKPLVVFTSEESHYSIQKGASWLGLGMDNVVKIKTDPGGCMLTEELESAILQAKDQDKEPFFVNATSGSTVLGAYDNLDKIHKICRQYKVWCHVDACWGGVALLSRNLRCLMHGVENVDSLSYNPHKMLGAPLQASIFLTKHPGLLHEANSANAAYLFQQDKFYDMSYDTGDKSIQCGRKVDAFKLWFMLKARGEAYIENMVENAFQMADLFHKLILERPGFRLVPAYEKRKCTNVGFWYIPPRLQGQEETEDWWEEIHKIAPIIKEKLILEGSLMIGYQPLVYKSYKNFFRMVVHCVPRPTPNHMLQVLDLIQEHGQCL